MGQFFGIMSVAQPALSSLLLHLLQKYCSEEILAALGLFSLITRNVIDGFASKGWMLYLCE